jgi:hypothetical protein
MTRMGAPAKLYKSHSLRKGGVTAMLAAGVPLPQIQLMARWASPNMAQLYAALTAKKSAEVFSVIGGFDTLSVRDQEQKFWQTCTTRPRPGSSFWRLAAAKDVSQPWRSETKDVSQGGAFAKERDEGRETPRGGDGRCHAVCRRHGGERGGIASGGTVAALGVSRLCG